MMMHVNVQDNRKKRVVSCPSTTAEKNEFILPKKEKIQSSVFREISCESTFAPAWYKRKTNHNTAMYVFGQEKFITLDKKLDV
jgi:hypothetical protein